MRAALTRHLIPGARLRLGLSGGLDSIVLLHVLAQLRPDYKLSALHVHHGLSTQADAWVQFCEQACSHLQVPLKVVRVKIARKTPEGIEAAARTARYGALMSPGVDAVITAHHADDQAETVLFQVLRGGGPRALAAMPEARQLATDLLLVRPLLTCARAELESYARLHGLLWVEDESNTDPRYARNALRHEVMPAIARFIPDYRERLIGSAQRMAEAADLLDELAALDGAEAGLPSSLDGKTLEALPEVRARNLLAYYLRLNGVPLPSPAHLTEMLRQLKEARTRLALHLPDGRVLARSKGRIRIDAS
ncbi:MAG: tRNA lysidine(34) synthetase TilS [Thiobacillaceae bacterium]